MKSVLFVIITLLAPSIAYAQDYFGEWIVGTIVHSHISNLSLDEAKTFLGQALLYNKSEVSFGSVTCKNVIFNEALFNERELYNYHKAFFSDLDIKNGSTVLNVEITCNDTTWSRFGAFVIHTDSKTFVSYSGHIYALQRKSANW
ncbi:hypothetical protein [Pseudoalteromonas rubra]|uniref:DUF4440 domain-containing protein n=1 Tax=Pseudoalteromonas rubra TaxID=43658 RepID=A0A0U3GNH4_9GAMM|nr:hypothetical protein [Pseudoalteromonas rubra]ALU44571.1 hypothetical protein AT705_17500 [Pseudoalteromonas rubra]